MTSSRDANDRPSDSTSVSGGFHGYSVDLLNALSKKLGFSYSLYPVSEGQRDHDLLPNGSWTGLVGEIINQVVILASD